MNAKVYPPATRLANEVYARSGVVVREYGEAEGDDEAYYQGLTRLLPTLIRFYDHIYATLPEIDSAYPWADGKFDNEKKRRKSTAATPILAKPCGSKVANAFVWPIFSAFRTLLVDNGDATLRFRVDPFGLFNDMKAELATTVQSFHRNQAHGLVQQVGKDKELWLRLQAQVETELKVRERLGTAS